MRLCSDGRCEDFDIRPPPGCHRMDRGGDCRMTTVSIVYYTNKGHTGVIAEAIARGAASVDGVEARLVRILPEHVVNGRYQNEALMNKLDESDAIIFGAPTF